MRVGFGLKAIWLAGLVSAVLLVSGCQSPEEKGRDSSADSVTTIEPFDTTALEPGGLPEKLYDLGIQIREPMDVPDILALGFEKAPHSEHFLWEDEEPNGGIETLLAPGDAFYVREISSSQLLAFADVYVTFRNGQLKTVEFFVAATDEEENGQMKAIASWLYKNRIWTAFNHYKGRKTGQKGYAADLAELNESYKDGIGKRIIKDFPEDAAMIGFYSYQPGLAYSVSNSEI